MTIQVNNDVLSYYVRNAQIPYGVLQAKVKHLDQFLSGEKQPTFNQLSDIAKKLNIPTGLLLLNKTIETQNKRLEFRTLDSQAVQSMSEALRDTIAEMQFKQDFLRNEIDEELDFIGQYSIEDDALVLASVIRRKLDIPVFFQAAARGNPLQYMREKINAIGVFVFFNGKVKSNAHRALSINEFRGFVLSDRKAPIIFVNQKDSKAGQLFTLIHELIHLFVGIDEIFNLVDTGEYQFDPLEAFINKVTAELLVPESKFLPIRTELSYKLASRFLVSEFVIVRRLLDFKVITQAEYKDRVAALKENLQHHLPEKTSSSGNYKNNIRFMVDGRFLHLIEQAIHQHRLSYTGAFNLLGVGYKGYKALTEGVAND